MYKWGAEYQALNGKKNSGKKQGDYVWADKETSLKA
jgi:hypothetical protein